MAFDVDPTGRRITVPGIEQAPQLVSDPEKTLRDPKLIRLSTAGGAAATIYPAMGFNCIDLRLKLGDRVVNVVHSEPDVLAGGSATHNGIPILFPWPNRIAESRYEWNGAEYRLTPNDPNKRHCLHGFACDTAWTSFACEDTGDVPCVTGVFRLSADAADRAGGWPGDLILNLTFTLTDSAFTITSTVSNPDDHAVPFGLGFHPYFTPLLASSIEECRVWVDADDFWELDGCIPTREVLPVDARLDFRAGPELGSRVLDDVVTGLSTFEADADGLMERARMVGGDAALVMRCDASWRDVVVFTPVNRASFAIEPYTCPTDAVNMAGEGSDVGWRVLDPGGTWTGVVELSIVPAAPAD